jgi:hypothetical protein
MIEVLQQQETEMGPTIREALTKRHGIVCEPVREALPVEQDAFVMFRPWVALFRYVRPSNGQTVYLIEMELFTPPDAQWWRSWVVDGEPTDEQLLTIITSNAQPGSRV